MRNKCVIAATAGALTLTGLAVAAPARAGTDTTEDSTSSPIDRIKDALAGLVGDGSITQEQADEVASTLSEAGLGGRGGHHGGGVGLAAAAEARGISEDDLHTALAADGATLARVAEDHGVAVDTVVQALVTAEQERIAQGVTDGRITQEQADQRLADLEQRVTDRVNADFEDRGQRGDRDEAVGLPDESAND